MNKILEKQKQGKELTDDEKRILNVLKEK